MMAVKKAGPTMLEPVDARVKALIAACQWAANSILAVM